MLKNAIWIFTITFLILIWFLPSFTKLQDIRQKDFECQKQIKKLEAEQKLLLKERKSLLEDPEYSEKIAREKMGLIREGEMIYRVEPVPVNAVGK
jgi:cell division protein FtsB